MRGSPLTSTPIMRQMDTLISVIVPVYQVEPYITDCVRSVIEQRERRIELILIDDCGGDSSVELALNTLTQSDINWKLLRHSHNRGLSAARNTGVDHAVGKYLFFLDSDDTLPPDALELLLQQAERTEADITVGNFADIRDGKLILRNSERMEKAAQQPSPAAAYLTGYLFPMACNKLIRTDWYHRTGVRFIEGILHEDEPWTLSLTLRTRHLEYVNAITYHYLQREGSITHNADNEKKRLLGRIYMVRNASAEREWVAPELLPLYFNWYCGRTYHCLRDIESGHYPDRKQLLRDTLSTVWNPGQRIISQVENIHMAIILRLARLLPLHTAYRLWHLADSCVRAARKCRHK